MKLTTDNYYSLEADKEFMSCSQYQGWLECEAKQKAKLDGRWVDEDKEAFLVGNYFHTFFEGEEAHEAFKIEHEDVIFKKPTKKDIELGILPKYAPYEQADKMIAAAMRDPLIKGLIDLQGEHECIMTGQIFGVPWRIRIDKYIDEGRTIIDWKTTKNIRETIYNPVTKERDTFVEAYGYMMRAAVYTEIEKQTTKQERDATFIIVAISKQDYPDKEVLLLNHRQQYDWELAQIGEKIQHIVRVKNGIVKPTRCGNCDYCRATKILYQIIPYYKLKPEYREGREEENDANAGTVLVEAQEAGTMEQLPPMP